MATGTEDEGKDFARLWPSRERVGSRKKKEYADVSKSSPKDSPRFRLSWKWPRERQSGRYEENFGRESGSIRDWDCGAQGFARSSCAMCACRRFSSLSARPC